MGNIIKITYQVFKWSIFIAIIFAFAISAQCQEAINDICIKTGTCDPDYEKVDRLRQRSPGTTRKMVEKDG
jgi:hypothetical protein